jgi:hypothetical protein
MRQKAPTDVGHYPSSHAAIVTRTASAKPARNWIGERIMGTNYWVVDRKYEFVNWSADFPPGRMSKLLEMLPFIQKVLEFAEKEEVFRVVYVPYTDYEFNGQYRVPTLDPKREYRWKPGGQTYTQYLEQMLSETGGDLNEVFFPQISTSPGYLPQYRSIAPARLSYYDIDGTLIVDKEVEDLGELLQRVRPLEFDLPSDWREYTEKQLFYEKKAVNDYKAEGSAIYLSGSLGSENSESDYGSYLYIHLYSDIWFPKVGGFLEDQPQPYGHRVFFDNSELASHHTPRLNRFLASVRELTLELGGSWDIDKPPKGSPDPYGEHCDENGIILDI